MRDRNNTVEKWWDDSMIESSVQVMEKIAEHQSAQDPASGTQADMLDRMTEMKPAAEQKFSVKSLDLHYGSFQALKNISLEIGTNEIMALIGPSGCGKSTFLKTLNRMNDLEEGVTIDGSVKLDGTDIYHNMNAIELRQRVGMVFQQPNPFPKSVYDNVAYGPRIRGIKKKSTLDETVERCLTEVGIWAEMKDRLYKSALGLSGGQQQRLCIARTLAVEPEVILMDEPTSALDPISTMKIEDLATELKKKYTIVIVTHNMQQANRISDKTAFFLLGEMMECGTTQDIFLNPKNKKTEEYISGRFG
jgi:phosphate transport system ATP-binding protein